MADGKILLDYPPDSYGHYLSAGAARFNLPQIQQLFITHSHMDHFFPAELKLRRPMPRIQMEPLHIYGSKAVEEKLGPIRPMEENGPFIEFHCLKFFESVMVGAYRITPLPARHDENEDCFIFAIEHDDKALLYTHDTTLFPDPTWDYLTEKQLVFGLISLDATFMQKEGRKGHMGIAENIEVRDRLFSTGAADRKTVFVLNHFSHQGGLNHGELSKTIEKDNFLAAYDGMEIEF